MIVCIWTQNSTVVDIVVLASDIVRIVVDEIVEWRNGIDEVNIWTENIRDIRR